MTNFLAAVDGEVDRAVESYAQMRDGYKDIHFFSPELSSWHHLAEFNDVDEGLEAVTYCKCQDDDDEDGGDEMLPPGPSGRPGQQLSLLLQRFVDDKVDDDKSDERHQIDSDRHQSPYLKSLNFLNQQDFEYGPPMHWQCQALFISENFLTFTSVT